ncbi:hypothetical protein OPT61_g5939 [Boeremia exigua]|uniref:Uncharacterized protein n=1 Tax=Boeremia exigua TaxID=749465 RepID=A0ACC2I8R7_9PLEO|nr:hypothetical protein OPT61_g5939 [Boeremia exigua]
MGGYEELVELGFEGVDKAVDKYHDKVYDTVGKHPPSWHWRHRHDQKQKEQRNPPASEAHRDDPRTYQNSQAGANMYASDRRQEREYQDRRDPRYVSDETLYYRGPDAGAVVMRGSDPYNNAREYEVQYQQPQYNSRRPQPQRRRSSWSPQRSGRERGNERRARSRSRSRSRSKEKQHRIAATVAGGLIGGLIGNQVQKGRKYDTAATIAGAVIGGLGAREASEQWDKRRTRREDCDEKWENKYGDNRDRKRDDRDDRDYRDDRYDDRRRYNDRDWR